MFPMLLKTWLSHCLQPSIEGLFTEVSAPSSHCCMLAQLSSTLVMEKTSFPGDLVFASQLFQQLCHFLRKLCLSLNEILKCFISKPHTKYPKGPDLGILEDKGALKGDLRGKAAK